jgi:hypothetical protein
MKVIIAGSRDFKDFEKVWTHMDKLPWEVTEVVCGGARGADRLGERWAKENAIPVKYFYPDWNHEGRGAGYRRNEEMAKYADCLVAFDMGTKGTAHMIACAKHYGLGCYIVHIKPKP